MTSTPLSWTRLADPPETLNYGVATNWTHDTFVLAPECEAYAFDKHTVHRYNAMTRKWDIAVKYPRQFWHLRAWSIAANTKGNRLYVLSRNVERSRTEMWTCYLNVPMVRETLSIVDGMEPHGLRLSHGLQSILYINGQLHCFTMEAHFIWNGKAANSAYFEEIPNCPWESIGWFPDCRFIAVPSKNIILLIGCRGFNFDILKYSVDDKKWSRTEIEFTYIRPSAVLTPSEEYVILSGGKEENGNRSRFVDKMHILDIRADSKWTLYESKVRIPMNINYHLAVTGGDHGGRLAIGWTRQLFKQQEYSNLSFPPLYLLQLIGRWVSCEELHWIRKGKYAIPRLDDNYSNTIDQTNQALGGLHMSINLKHVLSK